MKKNCRIHSKYYKCMAFVTVCMLLVGLVFYTIFMVRTFINGTDWLVGILLVFGALGMIFILPALANTFMALGLTIEKDNCDEMKK